MARYTGPKHKLARRFGSNILDKESASLRRRLHARPGVHGRRPKRRPSEYGTQLLEKQKARSMYGLLERPFRRVLERAERYPGDTGERLVSLLETRLDNVVYRLGFAKTRAMARQFVTHGHVRVNGRRVNIPSYQVRPGDVVSLTERIRATPDIEALVVDERSVPPYLERRGPEGRLVRMPAWGDVEVPFDPRQIVEFYSR